MFLFNCSVAIVIKFCTIYHQRVIINLIFASFVVAKFTVDRSYKISMGHENNLEMIQIDQNVCLFVFVGYFVTT